MFNKRVRQTYIKLLSVFILMSLFLLNTFECYAYERDKDFQFIFLNESYYKPTSGFESNWEYGREALNLGDFLWTRNPDDLNTGNGGAIGEGDPDDPNGNGGYVGEGDPDDPNNNGGMIGEVDPIEDGIGVLILLLLSYALFIKFKKPKNT